MRARRVYQREFIHNRPYLSAIRDRLIIRQSNLDAERQRDRLERKARVFQDAVLSVPGVRAG